MIILALDSTETTVSAAISDGERLIAETVINAKLNHSETLLPVIEGLMKGAALNYSDIDLFACSEGPGSFTGVRIGAATVKGLAFGRNKPCVGVSALLAMAYNFVGQKGIVCPVMDARRNQLYNAVFRLSGGKPERLTPDRVISAEELAKELDNYNEPIYFVGGGYEIIHRFCESNKNVIKTPELLRYQNGFSVALAALDKYDLGDGDFTDKALSPSYLRPSSAERSKENG